MNSPNPQAADTGVSAEATEFQKRPVNIWAIQWTGDNLDAVMAFCAGNATYELMFRDNSEIVISTLEDGADKVARHVADKGDWIIRGIKGEFYPCKPDIFEATYTAPPPPVGAPQGVTEPPPFPKWHGFFENDAITAGYTAEQMITYARAFAAATPPPVGAPQGVPETLLELARDCQGAGALPTDLCASLIAASNNILTGTASLSDSKACADAADLLATPPSAAIAPLVAAPQAAVDAPPLWHCWAYGESDYPCVTLAKTRQEVIEFLCREWFGIKVDEVGNDEMATSVIAEFDAPDWDMGDSLDYKFEIGGVTITRLSVAAIASTPATGEGAQS